MIQEKRFLYRVPVKTAPITTPRGQIRNPEILVDLEGGEFMHGNILDANSTNKLVNQSVKEAVDNKLNESGYVTKDLLEAETTRATEQENSLKTLIDAETSARTKGDEDLSSKIKAEQTRAEGKEKEISDKLAIVNGDSNTEGSFRKAIADVVAAAPEDLDTLKEIADKLAGNDDLHTALNQAITEKADASALANEVARATGAESGLQAAIATKADATALSNYVLTTALNKQVDTLNAAISAKQDAGSYIHYDQTVTSRYKIDKDLMIDNSEGSAVLGTASISAISNSNTEIQINPSGITMRDDDNVIRLARKGITLPDGDNDHVLTSYGSTLNIGEYATQSDLSAQLGPKADRSDLLTLEQRITANTTAIEDKQDAGYYVTYIRDDGTKYTLQKGLELGDGERTVTINEGGMDIRIFENRIALGTGIIGSNGDDSYSIDCNNIHLHNMGCEITISPIGISSVTDEYTTLFNIGSTAIILGPTNNPNVKISEEGIKFKGKTNSYIPTADGDFIELSSLASAEDVSSLMVGLSKKQNKITVNTIDITDIETADVTKLRTIVTNLISALISSGLINATHGVE